jgi:UDP-3-O-[3-hydroxymyristoyl] N-acetylglucosamine deacetylase/3-hydroxyacyl-[acyl-carrier-protein] dehydratase
MKKALLTLVSVLLLSGHLQAQLPKETAEQKTERMKWWTEARFGMFCHWGLYAMPARHEWVRNKEKISDEDYQKYFEIYNPDLFQPAAWARMAKEAGMKYFVITAKHHEGFCNWDSKFTEYKITTLIDFNSPVLGTQHAMLKSMKDFRAEIAPCRTFVFLHELEMLLDHDLIKGGDVNNAIVVVDKPITDEEKNRLKGVFKKDDIEIQGEGYLNNLKLHYPNEPARHKLLDIVGDLALIGYPVKTHIIAHRPGHMANVEFAKKIKQYIKKNKNTRDLPVYDSTLPPVYDLQGIEKTLPHRHPFLLVDKIIELTDKCIVGVKNVTFNEWFFMGHFPGNPIMPGVLQIEALAQTGGILCINSMPEGKYDTYFLKIENCKFKAKVVPGDTMLLKMDLLEPIRRGICHMRGTVIVGNKICTEAELTAQIVKTS